MINHNSTHSLTQSSPFIKRACFIRRVHILFLQLLQFPILQQVNTIVCESLSCTPLWESINVVELSCITLADILKVFISFPSDSIPITVQQIIGLNPRPDSKFSDLNYFSKVHMGVGSSRTVRYVRQQRVAAESR